MSGQPEASREFTTASCLTSILRILFFRVLQFMLNVHVRILQIEEEQ